MPPIKAMPLQEFEKTEGYIREEERMKGQLILSQIKK